MKTVRLPAQKCPKCEHVLDAATAVRSNEEPSPGSITMCLGCLGFLQWDEQMTLQPLPRATFLALDAEERLLLLRMRKYAENVKAREKARNN